MFSYERRISAIIPLNDLRFTENIKTLSKFKNIKEVIVLNNSGEDIFPLSDNMVVVKIVDFDHGRTRNMGASIASGDVLLFMTQDARPAGDDFDLNILQSFSEEVKAVYGKHIPYLYNKFEKFERNFIYGDKPLIKPLTDEINFFDLFVSDVCLAVEKKVFDEVGGFPEDVICSEELILSHKIIKSGYKIMYNPSVKVIHSHHDEGFFTSFRRWFDVGVFFSKYPRISYGFYRYAFSLFLHEFFFFLKNNPDLLPHLILRGFVRFSALRIGSKHRYIPRELAKFFSLNRNFWKEIG